MENDDDIISPQNTNEFLQNTITYDNDFNGRGIGANSEGASTKNSIHERIASLKIFRVDYWWWPTYEDVLWKISIAVIILLIWGATYASTGHHAAPGGGIFNLGILVISAYIVANIGSYIALPPLSSMLLIGATFRNAKIIDIKTTVNSEILSQIRCLALTLVLIRAGLGLDATALKKLSMAVIRLAFIPCVVEGMGVAIAAYFILDLPILWSLLLGSTLGAVSPAVTVHYLLALKEQGYGVDKGIPTLLIAASSIDDILAISLFGVILSIIFSSGSLVTKILQGPMELCIGIVCGVILGTTAVFLPHETTLHVAFYRSIILGSGSYFAVLGSRRFEMVGAGYMASITSSFVASYGWKRLEWIEGGKPVQHGFSIAWQVVQHFLFTLIGYELDLGNMDWFNVLLQISTLGSGLLTRMATTFIVTLGANFNWKEQLFITIAWIPKATVQAALGPTALDLVHKHHRSEEERHYAEVILSMAVLAILITAPLGVLGILFTGTKLLSKEPTELERRWPQLQEFLQPPPRKGIFSCLGNRQERERLEGYLSLHRGSMLLSMDHDSLHTVV